MSQPGGNDEVIRVVYQAVADYSQMLRETRKAQQETRQLKADIDALAGTTTARVKVTADTAQARSELGRVLRDVMVKVKVTVDAAAANTELTRLLRDVTVKAKVIVDSVAARAEIARTLAALRDLSVKVRVQTDGAALSTLATQLARIRDLSVRVSVVVDDAALARLRAALAALRNLAVKVDVDVDAAALARLSARLSRVRAKVTVDLDDAGVMAAFRTLIARMQTIARVKIKVELDDSAFRRLTVLLGSLIRLRSQLNDLPGGGAPSPGDPSPSPRPTAPGDKKGPIPEGLSAAAGLVAKFVPLIAAAVPVAAGLAAMIGTVAAATLAAGAGFAVFAVAGIGAFAKVTEAVKAYEKSGTVSESGPLAAVVAKFEQLKDRYNALQKATQQPVFQVFTRGLQLATDLLGKVQPLITTVAGAIDTALGEVQQGLTGPGFDAFLAFVGRNAPAAIHGFTTGLVGLVGGLVKLIEQFQPFITGFVDGFARAGTAFDQWASSLSSNTSFQQFLAYAAAQMPRVIDLIVDVVKAAVNLAVALAPIGGLFFKIIAAAVHFLAILNPTALAAIIGGIVGLSLAIKTFQAIIAIQAAYAKFATFLSTLPGLLGRVTAALGVTRTAMIALGAATLIGAALTVAVIAISALNSASDKAAEASKRAADAADTHRRAVQSLTDALIANGGVVSAQDRVNAYKDLDTDPVKLPGKYDDSKLVDPTQIKTVAGYAGEAGIDANTLASARLGDATALAKTGAALDALKAKYKALGDAASLLPKSDPRHLDAAQYYATADAIGAAGDQMKSYGGIAGEAAAQAKILNDLTNGTGTAMQNTAGEYYKAADAAKALKEALQADFSSDANTALYDKATAAADAYDAQVQTLKDAERAQTRAVQDAKTAQDNLNAARAAAVQRIKDVQRALRDGALDERQAKLSNKEAQQKLADVIANGGTDDEIEQARIDAERAANAVSDLEQDKKPKTDALKKELAAGVDGNKQLQTAVRANEDAQTALTAANTNVGKATTKLTELQLAYQTAAAAFGMNDQQLRDFRNRMDAVKTKTVKIVLDTKDAEQAMRNLLQGQIILQLLAANPGWSYEKAAAEALKQIPTVAGSKDSTGGIQLAPGAGQSRDKPERAEGGPLLASPATAGPVWGPGTGTSDSILADLPAGGQVRLSRGEHIVTDAEVQAAPGGHGYLEAFRAGLRAGRPWAPRGYATGGALLGPATLSSGFAMDHGDPNRHRRRRELLGPATVSSGFAMATPALSFRSPVPAPVLSASGATMTAAAARTSAGDMSTHRTVTVNVGTITNAVPETAGDSLYRQVRKAVDGDER